MILPDVPPTIQKIYFRSKFLNHQYLTVFFTVTIRFMFFFLTNIFIDFVWSTNFWIFSYSIGLVGRTASAVPIAVSSSKMRQKQSEYRDREH